MQVNLIAARKVGGHIEILLHPDHRGSSGVLSWPAGANLFGGHVQGPCGRGHGAGPGDDSGFSLSPFGLGINRYAIVGSCVSARAAACA